MNEKLYLNNNGLKEFLGYLGTQLGTDLCDKFIIENNYLKMKEDKELKLRVYLPQSRVISEQPVGTGVDPSVVIPGESESGRETGVKELGRANLKRSKEEELKGLVKELEKFFPTKRELVDYLEKQEDQGTDKMKKALDTMVKSLEST